MDPLDDIFAAMRVSSALYARLECGAPWGVSLAGGEGARFGLVVRGSCLLEVEGMARPVPLVAGDCYVLAHGTPYVLRDKARTPTVSCKSVVRDRIGGVVELGGGGTAATILCGWFYFDRDAAQPLLELLPKLLHVQMDEARAQALQGTLQLLAMETCAPGLGSSLVVSRLADILFVQAVRAHVAATGDDKEGCWLRALKDARIGPVLREIHKDMARPWTVGELAGKASLSRSAFALRFKERVGKAPLEYLTTWRMFKARDLLRTGSGVSDVAGLVGYESEPAFSKAFKRDSGMSPGAWRTAQRVPASAKSP
ncbi:MAG: transcriptional regulator, AraC family [Polaromonas sp.]|nr:transcriptional regulator, AraC family [Polaromonas sp.]